MNKAILTGNLTKDPELRATNSGTSVCTFTIAVQRKYKGTDDKTPVDYLNIIVWRQLGELCGKYLSKGRKVLVEGEIQNRSYEDKEGNKRYVTEITAENVEFLTPRDKSEKSDIPAGFTEVDDEPLPF